MPAVFEGQEIQSTSKTQAGTWDCRGSDAFERFQFDSGVHVFLRFSQCHGVLQFFAQVHDQMRSTAAILASREATRQLVWPAGKTHSMYIYNSFLPTCQLVGTSILACT